MSRPTKEDKLQQVVLYVSKELKNHINDCDKKMLIKYIDDYFIVGNQPIVNYVNYEPSRSAPTTKKLNKTQCQTFFK